MITCISGLPGGGKSYLMTYRIMRYLKQERMVLCNYPVPGTYKLTFEDMIEAEFPEGAVIVIDEANSWFRNRDWQSFPKEVFQLFMHHRHYSLDMDIIAQNPMTLDTTIRDIINVYIWCQLSMYIPRKNKLGLHYKHALMFKLIQYHNIEYIGNISKAFGIRRMAARKKVFNYFDSYYKFIEMDRKKKEWQLWESI